MHCTIPLNLNVLLFQEKDFEFMDNDVLDEPYGLDTLQDDEDYQAQQPGSGFGPGGPYPDYNALDNAGSGDIEDGITTQPPDDTTPGMLSSTFTSCPNQHRAEPVIYDHHVLCHNVIRQCSR